MTREKAMLCYNYWVAASRARPCDARASLLKELWARAIATRLYEELPTVVREAEEKLLSLYNEGKLKRLVIESEDAFI